MLPYEEAEHFYRIGLQQGWECAKRDMTLEQTMFHGEAMLRLISAARLLFEFVRGGFRA